MANLTYLSDDDRPASDRLGRLKQANEWAADKMRDLRSEQCPPGRVDDSRRLGARPGPSLASSSRTTAGR